MDGFAGSKTANNRPASHRVPWASKQRGGGQQEKVFTGRDVNNGNDDLTEGERSDAISKMSDPTYRADFRK